MSAAQAQRRFRACLAGMIAAAGLLAVPTVAGTARAAPTTQPDAADTSANARHVRDAFDAWAAGTGSVFDLLHTDVVWTVAGTSPVSGTYVSREDFIDRAVRPITARLATPIVPKVRHVVAQGDTVMVVFDGTATTRDGGIYRNTYAWHMVLDGGRIIRAVAFLDTWALQSLMEG